MRRAKIVCTIGPASSSPEVLDTLIDAGMDVARLNFSHGTHEDHREVYASVRAAALRAGRPVAILQDLQGPKIRVGIFENGQVELVNGARFRLCVDECIGDERQASIAYPDLPQDVSIGEDLLLDDGLLQLRVVEVSERWVDTEVIVGGTLKNRKGVNLPDTRISLPSLTDKDKIDLDLGLELGVDFVALSFVRSGLDIHQLRARLAGQDDPPHIIAKIEKPQAVQNLMEIVSASDGIMVARGDLGVELPPEKVPSIQKQMIDMANSLGKFAITATQMLESMTTNPRPTRAEASDVANAIFDGTDAVMLSAETASGKYPVESVQIMNRIILEAEKSTHRDVLKARITDTPHIRTSAVAVARAAVAAAEELNVRVISCFTVSGSTPRLVKALGPKQRIVAFTPSVPMWHRMALYRGVTPVLVEVSYESDDLFQMVETELSKTGGVASGEYTIIIMGVPAGTGARANLVKVHQMQ
ncbi:MAG: pyruvate kinase [Bradymonadia bacterium]|jgi:pyruvate kinase